MAPSRIQIRSNRCRPLGQAVCAVAAQDHWHQLQAIHPQTHRCSINLRHRYPTASQFRQTLQAPNTSECTATARPTPPATQRTGIRRPSSAISQKSLHKVDSGRSIRSQRPNVGGWHSRDGCDHLICPGAFSNFLAPRSKRRTCCTVVQ